VFTARRFRARRKCRCGATTVKMTEWHPEKRSDENWVIIEGLIREDLRTKTVMRTSLGNEGIFKPVQR
jgi:hypothetical protein